MKKILITGANSYIGTSFENWIKQFDGYTVDTVDTLNERWKTADFSAYDVVFHVAGLAHANPKPEMKNLYYSVNTDLAVEIAEHAKISGVKQFVFMSSIIVYGKDNVYIDDNTVPKPVNFYGDSKLKADLRLHKLQGDGFNVVSVRPPMVYGKGAKGNYIRLSKIAQKIPVFPDVSNQRSMLYIENLCEFIRMMIDNDEHGIFYPQNKEYVSTADLVKEIADAHGKKVHMISLFNPILKMLSDKITTFNKLFGNLVYAKEISAYADFRYCVVDFKESIKRTEG